MGEGVSDLNLAAQPPAVILMAGLQGAGKTTTVGKLAKLLREKYKKKVLTVSCDVYRPAAIAQLKMVTEQLEKQQGELVTLRGDLKAQNEDLRTQANEIRTQQGDIRFLQSEIRKLKSRLRCMSERMKEYWNELVERGGSPAPLPDWIDEYMEETDDKD
jgi:energy-coupling factor transporter ATP-binding protein EcfA2